MSVVAGTNGQASGSSSSAAQPQSLAGPSGPSHREQPGGGPAPLIQLRSKTPLPLFNCPHPIPPPSSTIGETLKLSVLRLLAGEMTQTSSTAPMTASEQLKLMTIHGWRMQMIALELRQNVLIAPESRDKIGEGADDDMEGFELADDSECGLLEADDEVLIRLKPAYTLADLHLPKLPSSHQYALPPGSLTRAGTLSNPPPYSQVNIKRAAEPSSHSSSVQGQPEADYHARQYRDYSRGFRVVTVQSGVGGVAATQTPAEAKEARKARASSNPALAGPSRPLGLGMGVEPPAAAPAPAIYKPSVAKPRRSNSNNVLTTNGPAAGITSPPLSNVAINSQAASSVIPPLSPTLMSPGQESTAAGLSSTAKPPRPSAARASTSNVITSGSRKVSASASDVATTNGTVFTGKPAGQGAMPLSALVIGPGVQGAVGRGSNAAMGHAGPGASSAEKTGMSSNGEYGNAKAFASFTAAGGEVGHRAKPRRTSSHSSTQQQDKDRRKLSQSARTKSSEMLQSALDDGSALETGADPSTSYTPADPAKAGLAAAQRRAQAARSAATTTTTANLDASPFPASPQLDEIAEGGSVPHAQGRPSKERRPSSGKVKREKVELPTPPILPPITNLAPFPEPHSSPVERDLPPMPTPADVKPNVTSSPKASATPLPHSPSNGSRQRLSRHQSQPAMRRQNSSAGPNGASNAKANNEQTTRGEPALPSADGINEPSTGDSRRPTNSRQLSLATRPGLESHGSDVALSTGSGVDDTNAKGKSKPNRFARLAAPGLGLGGGGKPPAPPLLQQRKSSSKSVLSSMGWLAGAKEPAQSGGDGDAEPSNVSRDAVDTTHESPSSEHVNGNDETAEGKSKPKLSKAERRYLEYQRQRSTEVSRQAQAEEERLKEADKAKAAKEKEERRRQEELRHKREKEKWEVWEEVRRRADAEKTKETEPINAAKPAK